MRDNGSVYLNSVCVGTTFVCLFKDKVVLKLWFDFFAQNFLEIPIGDFKSTRDEDTCGCKPLLMSQFYEFELGLKPTS